MTETRISPPAWLALPEVQTLLAAFGTHELRFVGGCVRDTLMGRSVGDMDAATPAPPEAVTALLAAAGIRVIPTGLKHGTVTALIGRRSFEITTLREDAACDGRHAEVRYTDDWEADAARRDFTLNALYMDAAGTLYAYGSGVEDARRGRIRFIGDARDRIREDYLRILRFFRFYATHGTPPADTEARAACRAEAEGIALLSGERIRGEMLTLLAAPRPMESLSLMAEAGVLAHMLPCPADLALCERLAAPADPLLRLAALIAAGGGEAACTLAERWRLSRAERERLARALTPPGGAFTEPRVKALIRRYGREAAGDWLRLGAARGETAGDGLLQLARDWQPPVFPVTGKDLLERGIPPGKAMGEQLRALEVEWEKSGYRPDKAALLSLL